MADKNCVLPLLPVNLQKLDIYQRINDLLCNQDDIWTDDELLDYLTRSGTIVRSSLTPNAVEITWGSAITWEESLEATWNDPNTYESSTVENNPLDKEKDLFQIFKSISNVRGKTISETGFLMWEHMIKPYVGTNLIQRVLLDTLGVTGRVNDWYNNYTSINTYDFVLSEFPGWDVADVLIDASKKLKNAESKLTSLKDENCVPRLELSNGGRLNNELLSDVATGEYKDVFICFHRITDIFVDVDFDDLNVNHDVHREANKRLWFFERQYLSDNLFLDNPPPNKLYRTYEHGRPGRYVQMFPAYLWGDSTWMQKVTWESHYKWTGPQIEGLVRLEIGKNPIIWAPEYLWSDDLEWRGDPDDWLFNRPCTLNECIEDRNFIPGFGPSDGKSLYNVLIFAEHTRVNIEDSELIDNPLTWDNDGNLYFIDGEVGLYDGNLR